MVELHIDGSVLEVAEGEIEQFVGKNIWMFEYQGKTYFHPDKFTAARNKTSDVWMDGVVPENALKSLGGLVAEKPKGGIFSRGGDPDSSKSLTIPVTSETGHSSLAGVWFAKRALGAAGGE